MPALSPQRFHFHGCAHAFNGQFTRPFHEQIDAQAQSVLPVTGGHGCARVEKFRFREFISFKAGYTHVSGGYQAEDESNNTLVTSALEGLNMLDVLTADRLVCRLYSKHRKDAVEGHITMHGSKFENLRICGYPVNIELDFRVFEEIPTFAQARKQFAKKGDFWKIAKDPHHSGKSLPDPGENGAFFCSLVKNMDVDYPGIERCGHSLYVPGFGKVFFAEVMISHGERSLTMLRYELGSSTSGSGSAGSGGTNGKQWPPPG